jgi:hypothetical protein
MKISIGKLVFKNSILKGREFMGLTESIPALIRNYRVEAFYPKNEGELNLVRFSLH